VLVISITGLNVSLPLFAGGFPPAHFSGPYFVLLFTTTCFVLFFGVSTLVAALACKSVKSRAFFSKDELKAYIFIGASSALNGILKVYASPGDRTSPILQALLSNTAFLWGIPVTKWLVLAKREYKYLALRPLVAITLVLLGLVLSLVPSIIRLINGQEKVFDSSGGLVWALIFMLAMIPSAFWNVLQELYLTKKDPNQTASWIQSTYDMFRMLFWSNVIQELIFIILFSVDIIPGFGFSPSASSFFANMKFTFGCFFNYQTCPDVWWKGLTFVITFICATIAGAEVNKSSATFGLIASTLGGPFAAIFWISFPSLSQDPTITPLWYVIPAMVCLIAGSVVWKKWEEIEKLKKKQGP